MKRFTRCPTCGASVRTENMPEHTRRVHAESRDSREVAGAKRPLMTHTKIDTYDRRYARGCRFVEQDEFEKALEINPKYPPAARNLAVLYEVREKASKDPECLKESEAYMQGGYF